MDIYETHGVFHKEVVCLFQNHKQFIFNPNLTGITNKPRLSPMRQTKSQVLHMKRRLKFLSSSTEQHSIYAAADDSPASKETSPAAEVRL